MEVRVRVRAKKSKLIIFKKSNEDRRKKVDLRWRGTVVQTVKEFSYLRTYSQRTTVVESKFKI